jgi:hypothetical protein
MAINSLFDLDPSKFTLGKGSGTFRRVGEVGKKLNLSELMEGVSVPTAPTNVPTVTPLTAEQQSQIDAWGSDFTGFATRYMNSAPKGIHYTLDSAKRALSTGGTSYAYAQNAVKNKWSAKDEIWGQYLVTQDYLGKKNANQAITSAYNNEVSAYKAVVDPYKDQVAAYNQERETRAADYNKYAIDPALVSKEHNASTGEQLGASDLYSDQLHTMMLDKVSAANFEPEQDQVSSMFVGGKK